jgi:hypothetical protein
MRTRLTGFLLALLVPAAIRAEPCPPCPAGCIPLLYIQELKPPPEGQPVRACPEGCAPMEQVKSLLEIPGCEPQAAPPPPPPPPPASPPPPETRHVEATRNRIVLGPTAFLPPADQATFTGFGAGLWEFLYTLGDHVQVGTFFSLPVLVVGVFPEARFGFQLGEHVALGFGALGGLVFGYADDVWDDLFWLVGGHGELSLRFGDLMLNFSMLAFGAGFRWAGGKNDVLDGALLLPNFGLRWAFSRNWSLQLELTVPLLAHKGEVVNDDTPLVLLFYGFRGHGETMFGDVGFCLPLYDEFIEHIWKYVPLGFPYFSIGFYF